MPFIEPTPEMREVWEKEVGDETETRAGKELPPRPYIRSKELFFDEQMRHNEDELETEIDPDGTVHVIRDLRHADGKRRDELEANGN